MSLAAAAYWTKRALAREKHFMALTPKAVEGVNRAYRRAFENLEAELESIQAHMAKALETEGTTDSAAYGFREAAVLAAKAQIKAFREVLAKEEQAITAKFYRKVLEVSYYTSLFDIQKGVGLGFSVRRLPARAVRLALLENWKGRNFSKSIWRNTGLLAAKAQEIVGGGLMSGASIWTMTRQLEDVMETGRFVTERLIRSETSYFLNQGHLEAYREAGIEQYRYIATLDGRTSKICIGLDHEVFDVSEAEAGRNYPPMHAFCRSTTAAYFAEDDLSDMKRRARDPFTGVLREIPGDMSYQQWFGAYVVTDKNPSKGLRNQPEKGVI